MPVQQNPKSHQLASEYIILFRIITSINGLMQQPQTIRISGLKICVIIWNILCISILKEAAQFVLYIPEINN